MNAREKIANLLWLSVPSGDDAEAKARTDEMLDAFRAEVLNEAMGSLASLANLAPRSERAAGLNFAIGALMALRDHPSAAGQAPATRPAMPEDVRRAAIRAVEQHPSTTFMAPCESLADAVLDAVLPLLAGQAPAPSADGLREWQLTRDNITEIDDQVDKDGVYAKSYTETVNGKLTVTGLRIGIKPDHVVARFGDTIVRHADGTYSVRPAEGGAS